MRNAIPKLWIGFVVPCCLAGMGSAIGEDVSQTAEPVRRTIEIDGSEREYFVFLPADFRPDQTYWPLASVHGGGGNGRRHFLSTDMRRHVDAMGLDAIIVGPSFSKTDVAASRFPALGEGRFLRRVLDDLQSNFKLRPKILLAGYSRGAQFCHRFAMNNPKHVAAVACFSAGTWTTPKGELLIESVGVVDDPRAFLTNQKNRTGVPERLHDLFTPQVADVAGMRPQPGAGEIPFLVMCGTLDSRFAIAQQFANRLEGSGYEVETEWPRTPHGSRNSEEYKDEFQKYGRRAVEFFLRVTNEP